MSLHSLLAACRADGVEGGVVRGLLGGEGGEFACPATEAEHALIAELSEYGDQFQFPPAKNAGFASCADS